MFSWFQVGCAIYWIRSRKFQSFIKKWNSAATRLEEDQSVGGEREREELDPLCKWMSDCGWWLCSSTTLNKFADPSVWSIRRPYATSKENILAQVSCLSVCLSVYLPRISPPPCFDNRTSRFHILNNISRIFQLPTLVAVKLDVLFKRIPWYFGLCWYYSGYLI